MKPPNSYIDDRQTEELGSTSRVTGRLQPTPFTWRGNMCVNLSTLQAAAGHVNHSTTIANVQLHGNANEAAKLGNLNQPPK